jgi:hypothetical protein
VIAPVYSGVGRQATSLYTIGQQVLIWALFQVCELGFQLSKRALRLQSPDPRPSPPRPISPQPSGPRPPLVTAMFGTASLYATDPLRVRFAPPAASIKMFWVCRSANVPRYVRSRLYRAWTLPHRYGRGHLSIDPSRWTVARFCEDVALPRSYLLALSRRQPTSVRLAPPRHTPPRSHGRIDAAPHQRARWRD